MPVCRGVRPLVLDAGVAHRFGRGFDLKVAVIGAGPAGLTAAIYAARADLQPVVFEGEISANAAGQPGGQLMLTTDVENFPSHPDGVLGPTLIRAMRDQAYRFGAVFRSHSVSRIDGPAGDFSLSAVGDDDERSCNDDRFEAAIIATGARALMLGVEGEAEYLGKGVSTCATCDGFFYRNKTVAVVGGGDSALEEALFLTRFASRVVVVHRRRQLRASKILQLRAARHPKLSFCWDSVVVAVHGSDDLLEAIELEDVDSGERRSLLVDGVFIAIGHRPNSEFVRGQLALDSAGYIITEARSTRTSQPGVFACGDVQDATYRQAITAAGSGCMAALDVEQWLARPYVG